MDRSKARADRLAQIEAIMFVKEPLDKQKILMEKRLETLRARNQESDAASIAVVESRLAAIRKAEEKEKAKPKLTQEQEAYVRELKKVTGVQDQKDAGPKKGKVIAPEIKIPTAQQQNPSTVEMQAKFIEDAAKKTAPVDVSRQKALRTKRIATGVMIFSSAALVITIVTKLM